MSQLKLIIHSVILTALTIFFLFVGGYILAIFTSFFALLKVIKFIVNHKSK